MAHYIFLLSNTWDQLRDKGKPYQHNREEDTRSASLGTKLYAM